jgi:plastocyanin
MDESNNTPSGSSSSSKTGLIVGAVVLLLVAAAAYYFWSSSQTASTQQADSTANMNTPDTTATGTGTTATPAPMAASDSGTVAEDGSVTFTVDGSNFKFEPNQLKVKKDQKVKIVFNNVQGFHDFRIDELDVKTSQITAGNSATVEFTPDETGNFEFYCSVGQHRANGMKGTLVVE